MNEDVSKNARFRVSLTIASLALIVTLAVGATLFSSASTYEAPIHAPKVFPPSPNGCWLYFARTAAWKRTTCADSNATRSFSTTKTLNCDSSSGPCQFGEYGTNDPAAANIFGISSSGISPTTPPSTTYESGSGAAFWIGVQAESGYPLIQSGISYGNYQTSSTPAMWVEFVGNFNWNGNNCNPQYGFSCGAYDAVSVGDVIQPFEYSSQSCNTCSGYWYATAYDETTGVDLVISISTSVVGEGGFYNGLIIFEGFGLTGTSMLPSSPVTMNYVQVYSVDGFAQALYNPQVVCNQCGSGAITMTLSYSSQNAQWSW
ncbi:MAG: hypothetical protein JRN15_05105 [Nitrososphaerota archaeon]|jgi:hypothetical protein|nr:hypothetical protein [Nitrososphaerota archaeon]